MSAGCWAVLLAPVQNNPLVRGGLGRSRRSLFLDQIGCRTWWVYERGVLLIIEHGPDGVPPIAYAESLVLGEFAGGDRSTIRRAKTDHGHIREAEDISIGTQLTGAGAGNVCFDAIASEISCKDFVRYELDI